MEFNFLDDVVARNGVSTVRGYISAWDTIAGKLFYRITIPGNKGSIWASENAVERVVPIHI